MARVWRDLHISDDPVKQSNTRGRLTFATAGPNSRTTQLFINFGNNAQLDRMGFAPVGEVTSGMNVVDSLYSGYGDGGESGGKGPSRTSSPPRQRLPHAGLSEAGLHRDRTRLAGVEEEPVVPITFAPEWRPT